MKRKVAEIILILLFYLIQVTFGNAIGIGGITPNLLIILPVLFGFFKGRNEGMLVGFLSGVMYDLFFSSLFGFSALVFVYIGYFSGIFYKEYEKVEVLIPLAMIMASDFVFEFLSYIGNFLLHNRLNVDFFLRRFIMPEVVYTLVVALVLYYPLMKFDSILDIQWKKRKKGILDEGYLKDETDNSLIKMQDNYKQDGTYTKQVNYNLNIDNMYQCGLASNISIVLVEAKLNNAELNLLVKLDSTNNTYSLFLNDYITKNNYTKHMSIKSINISKNKIQKNNYNNDVKVEGTEKDVVIQYFSDYRMKMLNDTKIAYQKLDSEYAEKKFGQYSNFESYVNNNKNNIIVASIDKYQVVENKNGKEYVCVDENGKYYIFMEEEVGKYSVVLDTYTIDLPEFIEKYNSANEKTKVGLNIQKVFDAINNEDYEYVYNKLDNTFKQTNFKTVQEFKNYVIKNFSGKQLKYGECQQQGSLYIFDITITEGTKQTNKRVIMQLKDGTDFVMSFNVIGK